MKGILNSILALIALTVIVTACSGDSYQKRIDKENKAIENLLADSGITVLKKYPDNHKFAKNEYYLEEGTGVYLRVINPGDLTKALNDSIVVPLVTMRFDSVYQMVSGTYELGNNQPNHYEITFTYNDPTTYTSSNTSSLAWYYMSAATVLPLKKGLGPGAEVSLIVPFINGSPYQQSAYEPYFYPRVVYRFFIQEVEKDK